MIRRTHVARFLLVIPVVFLLVANGCGWSDNNERKLNSWCAVGLENLRTPVVDVHDLINEDGVEEGAPEEVNVPEDVCELHMFDYDAGFTPINSEAIESGRWGISDEGELALDLSLIHEYDDGLLLCRRPEGTCEPYQPGRRLVCQTTGDPLSLATASAAAIEGGLTTGAVLSVHPFEHDPNLVAVIWMYSHEQESWPHVTWISPGVDASGTAQPFSEKDDIDVCEVCEGVISDSDRGAPAHSYVAYQTATRGESLLLAGPCGSRTVVEVSSDGSCRSHQLVDPERDEERPEIALGVIETEEGWAALWTDGLALYSSLLTQGTGDSLQPGPPRLLALTSETQSRERPSSICVSGRNDGNPVCIALWTEETRFPIENDLFDDHGERSLHIDIFQETQTDQFTNFSSLLTTIEGFAGQVAVDIHLGEEHNLLEGISGLVVYRSRVFGLVARRWNFDLAGFTLGGTDHFLDLVIPVDQISDAAHLANPSMVWVRQGGFVVVWMEDDNEDGVYELRQALIEIPEEEPNTITHSGFSIHNEEHPEEPFLPTHLSTSPEDEAPSPVIASTSFSGADDTHRLLLIGASGDDGTGCKTSFALVPLSELNDAFPPDGELGPEASVLMSHQATVDTPGACRPECSGQARWRGDTFVVALPSESGVRILNVSPGEDRAEVEEMEVIPELSPGPSCHVTLEVDGDEGDGMVVFDVVDGTPVGERSLGSVQLYRGEEGRWTAYSTFVTLEEDVEASTPLFAPMFTYEDTRFLRDTPMISWSVHRFGQWKQNDFSLGRATVTDAGDLQIKGFPSIDHPVLDSRVAVAAGIPLPCDESGVAVGNNQCGMIAFSRPDFGEYRDSIGYHRIDQLTPLAEATLMPIGNQAENYICPACDVVDLIKGEDWRGLPTSLSLWVDVELPATRPIISFSKSSAVEWTSGTAAGFAFRAERDEEEKPLGWSSVQLDPSWTYGEDHGTRQVPFLRIASGGGQRFGSVWSSLTAVGQQDESQEAEETQELEAEGELFTWSLYFSLLQTNFTPLAGGVRLDGIGDEGGDSIVAIEGEEPQFLDLDGVDLEFIYSDPRSLMAEHLGAAVGDLGEGRFVVAWLYKDWTSSSEGEGDVRPLENISFYASQVTCQFIHDEP